MKFHRDGTLPNDEQIFVFGSNLSGIHGAGAAKAAIAYGAKPGWGVGQMDRTYAIPTKGHMLGVLDLGLIGQFVDEFKKHAAFHSDKEFFITRIGCGLAGFENKDIAPMFKGIGDNCSVAEEWQPFLS